ncbi:hypothetical protein SNOG_07176 [Parastagonospora nodorum SN15]|uniref:UBL3-like ubiquitin domain-containing protein n=1 Tax=Phaeosphaeria nodorum (strain SN15 / ATCC MYA-4574 / FGSC 10173) TaxID=321614 RepID=Q0UM38_PHANO|nr:hypothetical protein SNOG_07176 [Parastagonospora nodorum SN15]EAT85827.2 hypothetical protein SNOG_07176 [Parastagonospora nodorum SN15]
MASTGATQPPTAAQSSPQQAAVGARSENTAEELSSSPVEMRTLPPSDAVPASTTMAAPASAETSTSAAPAEITVPHTTESITAQPSQTAVASSAKPAPPTALNRAETEAIGPSTDTPAAVPDASNGPVVVIMLLLPSTGARHPYKIDEKYLKKRGVDVADMDPYNIDVYTLKELIWRDWREAQHVAFAASFMAGLIPVRASQYNASTVMGAVTPDLGLSTANTTCTEWEPRPTSPSSIRLIHFGRMLDDKAPLKDCRFQTENPNVVHMTVKPQEVVDDEDAKTGKGASRRDGEDEPTAGCRCVIL